MSVAPLDVVAAMFEARKNGNRARMMDYCCKDMSFTFNADPDKIGQGTTLIGWQAIFEHFARLKHHWDDLNSDVLSLSTDLNRPDQINALVSFKLRHRASGDILESVKRQEWIVRDGIVTRMTEILDDKALHTFQRLAAFNTPTPRDPYTPPITAGA